jgi:hypothetical protein
LLDLSSRGVSVVVDSLQRLPSIKDFDTPSLKILSINISQSSIAHLRQAKLNQTCLADVELTEACLLGAEIIDPDLSGANLIEHQLK